QWRRGVRGFEYCALAAMNAALADRIGERYGDDIPESLSLALAAAAEQIRAFSRDAKNLLALESQELLKGRLTYDMSKDPVVQELRSVLFGTAKSYGGRFKEIVSAIDAMLFPLLP
ncbi:MAG TPA: hypothetical protein VK445_01565, partial [Dissulfurispiraceae bacterium]|nr:hypothetical protein [Dissulfurispiraceae bacterium]